MKRPTPAFLHWTVLAILLSSLPMQGDSTTPPDATGASPGTAPKTSTASSSATTNGPSTNAPPKLTNKIPPGGNMTP